MEFGLEESGERRWTFTMPPVDEARPGSAVHTGLGGDGRVVAG